VFPFESAIAFGGPVALIGLWVLNFLILARPGAAKRGAKNLQESETIVVVRPAQEAGAEEVKPAAARDADEKKPGKSRDSSRQAARPSQDKPAEGRSEQAKAAKPKAESPKPEAPRPDQKGADAARPVPEVKKSAEPVDEQPAPATDAAEEGATLAGENAGAATESPEIQDGSDATDAGDRPPVD
jgi:FtsZ-interacting cell division protein ZipA